MTEERNTLLFEVAQKSFEEATANCLGATFNVIITFHLKQKFGKDPFEVFIVNPNQFYEGLTGVLSEGAEAIINLVGTYLFTKYKINTTVEEFTNIFSKDDKLGTKKLCSIFKNVIDQEEKKFKQN
ncbi:MAG: hypothetical protein GX638_00420 [Crenarchaeota archaeon]|nr:hypothetical protein [Thermoproteota archaeon]